MKAKDIANEVTIQPESSQRQFSVVAGISQYFPYYDQTLHPFKTKNFETYIEMLANDNIIYNDAYLSQDQIIDNYIRISQKNFNASQLSLSVHIGPFALQVSIANIKNQSQLHNCSNLNNDGGHGNIYFASRRNKKSAIKCLQLKEIIVDDFYKAISCKQEKLDSAGQLWKKVFFCHLKQYCFYRIFSALKLGPKTTRFLGFDIVCFQNCIQFSLEICNHNFQAPQHNLQEQFFQALKVMHLFNIVHRDIKPKNMMFSLTYNKFVFTDFGTTQILKERIGYPTWCNYIVGTPYYMCQQMRKRWLQGPGYKDTLIDFYYNDLYGLKLALENISQTQLNERDQAQSVQCYQIEDINLAIYLSQQIQLLKHNFFYQEKIVIKKYGLLIFELNLKKSIYNISLEQQSIRQYLQIDQKQSQKLKKSMHLYDKVYHKLQALKHEQICQIELDKFENYIHFSKIQNMNDQQSIQQYISIWVKQLKNNLQDRGYAEYLVVKIAKILDKNLVQFQKIKKLPKQRDKNVLFQMHICYDEDKVKLVQGQNVFSIQELRKKIIRFIQFNYNLKQQTKKTIQLIKAYYQNDKIQYYWMLIKSQQDQLKSLNSYFKMIFIIRGIEKNNFVRKYEQIQKLCSNCLEKKEKQLIKSIVEFTNKGDIVQLRKIKYIYDKFVQNSKFMSKLLYGYFYVLSQYMLVNAYFGQFNQLQKAQNNTKVYLRQLPNNKYTNQVKTLAEKFFINFYLDIGFSIMFYKYKASHWSGKVGRMQDIKNNNKQIFEYFFKGQNLNIAQNMGICCKIDYFNDRVCSLISYEKQTTKMLRKIDNLQEFLAIPTIKYDINLSKIKNFQRRERILKKLKIINENTESKVQQIISALQNDFDLFKCLLFFDQVKNWVPSKNKFLLRELLLTKYIERLYISGIQKAVLKSLVDVFCDNDQALYSFKVDENVKIENIMHIILIKNICRIFLESCNQSIRKKGDQLLIFMLQFLQKSNLNYTMNRIHYQQLCIYSLQRSGNIKLLFQILIQVCIKFTLMRQRTSFFQLLVLKQSLRICTLQTQKQLVKLMHDANFCQDQTFLQGRSIYIDLMLRIANSYPQSQKQKLNSWNLLLKIIINCFTKISSCLSLYLKKNLCRIAFQIYMFQRQSNQKTIFSKSSLRSHRKLQTVQKYKIRHSNCFIDNVSFYVGKLYHKPNQTYIKFKKFQNLKPARQIRKLIQTKKYIFHKNTKSIKFVKNEQILS